MILWLGDIHGDFYILRAILDAAKRDGRINIPMTIIQVGDFGWSPTFLNSMLPELPWPVYAIDGNHEYHPMLKGMDKVTEVKPNLFYVPRGTVLNIDGYDIGFMGGAHSVDKKWRQFGVDWWPDEEVTEQNINQMLAKVKSVDILVTHCPPKNFILRTFGPINKAYWGLSHDWEDISSLYIEKLWGSMGMPPIICGHMHRPVIDGQCKMLDVNEIFFLQPGMKPVDWYEVARENHEKSK